MNSIEPVSIKLPSTAWLVFVGICHRSISELGEDKITGESKERLTKLAIAILDEIDKFSAQSSPILRCRLIEFKLTRIEWLILLFTAKECADREPLLEEPVLAEFEKQFLNLPTIKPE
jgi:hypothetical protein